MKGRAANQRRIDIGPVLPAGKYNFQVIRASNVRWEEVARSKGEIYGASYIRRFCGGSNVQFSEPC